MARVFSPTLVAVIFRTRKDCTRRKRLTASTLLRADDRFTTLFVWLVYRLAIIQCSTTELSFSELGSANAITGRRLTTDRGPWLMRGRTIVGIVDSDIVLQRLDFQLARPSTSCPVPAAAADSTVWAWEGATSQAGNPPSAPRRYHFVPIALNHAKLCLPAIHKYTSSISRGLIGFKRLI